MPSGQLRDDKYESVQERLALHIGSGASVWEWTTGSRRGVKYLKHFPMPLLEELVAGRWLPIVGAGLSRNARVPNGRTMPLWDGLGKAVAGDLPDQAYVGAIDALSSYAHEFGRRELVRRLHRELLVEEAQPGEVHEAFSRLRFDKVITTNLEFLLERGYEQSGERCEVVIDEEQLPIPASRNATVLIKLHGDLRHPGRLVATEDDYDGFLGRYPVLATHVASLLIERVPVLVGYSLDDPDLRQLLALLRDRLGTMLPNAYVVVVGEDGALAARYERRGIKVIGLPGSKDRYGEVLTAAFRELDDYWRSRVLDEVRFRDERPLEQVETAVDRKSSRLCYFSVPVSLLAFYRDEVFPLAEQAGLVPVSGFDVEVEAGNRLAATRALIETSRLAVVDMSEGPASTELGAALQLLGPDNVFVITSSKTPAAAIASGTEVVTRPASLAEGREEFLEWMGGWFQRRSVPPAQPGAEAATLLQLRQWSAALIAAISDLEVMLFTRFADFSSQWARESRGRARPTLRRLLTSADLPIDDETRTRLLEWVALRNSALHERRSVSRAEARAAVADVDRVRQALGFESY